jgi:hypothetical protein
MNSSQLMGLGEPDLVGKRTLFQPPPPELATTPGIGVSTQTPEKRGSQGSRQSNKKVRRVHITTDLTLEALKAIQAIQQKHRVRTGKVLPMWKAVSLAVEHYAMAKEDPIFKT